MEDGAAGKKVGSTARSKSPTVVSNLRSCRIGLIASARTPCFSQKFVRSTPNCLADTQRFCLSDKMFKQGVAPRALAETKWTVRSASFFVQEKA